MSVGTNQIRSRQTTLLTDCCAKLDNPVAIKLCRICMRTRIQLDCGFSPITPIKNIKAMVKARGDFYR